MIIRISKSSVKAKKVVPAKQKDRHYFRRKWHLLNRSKKTKAVEYLKKKKLKGKTSDKCHIYGPNDHCKTLSET